MGIDNSAISFANTEESLKFYRDLFGMEVTGSILNLGQVQAHLPDDYRYSKGFLIKDPNRHALLLVT